MSALPISSKPSRAPFGGRPTDSIRSVRVAIVYAGTQANKGRCKDTALLFADLARGARAAEISRLRGPDALNAYEAYLAPAMMKMRALDVRCCLEVLRGGRAIVTTNIIHTCVTELSLGVCMTNAGTQLCMSQKQYGQSWPWPAW